MSLIAGRQGGNPLKKPDRNGRDDDFSARQRANYSLTNIERYYYTDRRELCQVLCPIFEKNCPAKEIRRTCGKGSRFALKNTVLPLKRCRTDAERQLQPIRAALPERLSGSICGQHCGFSKGDAVP